MFGFDEFRYELIDLSVKKLLVEGMIWNGSSIEDTFFLSETDKLNVNIDI